ncbi:regucalcin-like isoform X3 [Belonocnema kinseyi]|uniref:regucalcin-like isoform X3 n=1 Tax=Belonocnema kinseyi TaxID=2817044 RepID=UPI00143D87D4|nr:regucalcin-like isoform X3 [Belonocnema kinseyi]
MTIILAICAFSVFLPLVRCEDVERVVTRSGFTEGLYWDLATMKLYYEDPYGNSLCTYNPSTLNNYCANLGKDYLPSFIVPVEKHPGQFVVGASNNIISIKWDGDSNITLAKNQIKVLASVEKNIKNNVIECGAVDSSGKLWFGTANLMLAVNKSSVYTLDSNFKLETQITPVTFSSGLVWNAKNDKLYFVDSLTNQVASYDYDAKQGTVVNRKVVFDLRQHKISGTPEQLAIDDLGNLWVPISDSYQVIQINPDSQSLLRTVKIPAKKVKAVTFGDDSLQTLYVATVGYGYKDAAEKPPADDQFGGSIFAVKDLDVKGLEIKRGFQVNTK